MKISTPAGVGGKKQGEVPILPRFISDSIVDRQADQKQNLDEKKRVGQAKMVSVSTVSSPGPQPTKIDMKKKVKRNSTCQAVCDIICAAVLIVGISLIQVYLGHIVRRNLAQ